ncbi:sigma-70 family RNA polymerase sigma factor [Streptomyces sp. NPDC058548]|uniref:sigma-70 family RNA polymerase sigma factor n=1 Tax=unclassified Streptomyces TaxID=2593676 RepID=UPI00364BBB7E
MTGAGSRRPATPPTARTSEEALARIRRAHGGPLMSLLTSLTYGDSHRAEDLLQETMLRVWKHPEVLETDHESLRPWLFTVARRVAIDAHRARNNRVKEISDLVYEGPSAFFIDPIEPAIEAMDVRDALKQLNVKFRAVLVAVYFRGLSVQETADLLGLPPGTVKSRTYYALRVLRRTLRGYDGRV